MEIDAVHSPSASSSSSAAMQPEKDPKLAFLESLSPEEALRYKVLNSAKIPIDVTTTLLGGNMPAFAEDHEKEDLAVALAAAAKAFSIEMARLAADIRDAEEDAAGSSVDSEATPDDKRRRGPIRERHMVEAYRRLVLAGTLPAIAKAASLSFGGGEGNDEFAADAGSAAGTGAGAASGR